MPQGVTEGTYSPDPAPDDAPQSWSCLASPFNVIGLPYNVTEFFNSVS